MNLSHRRLSCALAACCLGGCGGLPWLKTPTVAPTARTAAQWQAPLPVLDSAAASLPAPPTPAPAATPDNPTASTPDTSAPAATDLRDWWARFNDPLLLALIDAARQASPTLASALGRIERARAERVAADATWLPQVNASASQSRGRAEPAAPLVRTTTSGVQASWEIDLFGVGRATSQAQRARLEGAQLAWHAAQLSVAADTGLGYSGLRACQAQLAQAELDAASRQETSRVSEAALKAGFLAPGQAALARASAAQGRAQVSAQQAQCDLLVKSLVALTGLDEPGLRQQLLAGQGRLPLPPPLAPSGVPADLLGQRPDLMEAAQAVTAAAADQRAANARQWPSISLTSTLGHARASTPLGVASGQVWSFGPLQLTLPVFDAGVRAANRAAAAASYQEAQALYQAKVRGAVREVEEALVNLHSSQQRARDASLAAEGYAQSLGAMQQRFKTGLASVLELEETRRANLAAQAAVIDLQHARVNAWITLYRALGGGWLPKPDPAPSPPG